MSDPAHIAGPNLVVGLTDGGTRYGRHTMGRRHMPSAVRKAEARLPAQCLSVD